MAWSIHYTPTQTQLACVTTASYGDNSHSRTIFNLYVPPSPFHFSISKYFYFSGKPSAVVFTSKLIFLVIEGRDHGRGSSGAVSFRLGFVACTLNGVSGRMVESEYHSPLQPPQAHRLCVNSGLNGLICQDSRYLGEEELMDSWGYKLMFAVEAVAEMTAIGFGLPKDAFTDLLKSGPHLLSPTGGDIGSHEKEDFCRISL
ncbi:hypothetical protein Tco_1500520 [Tanacetum coccineum]